MNPPALLMETDLGHDPDDVFALLYFLSVGVRLETVCVSPGDLYQVALVKGMLRAFGSTAKVLTPKARKPNGKLNEGFHEWLRVELGASLEEDPDGHEDALPVGDVEVFACGPVKMAHLIPQEHVLRFTMQGGFVPYAVHRPVHVPVLAKFEGLETCPTFNLGGTDKRWLPTLLGGAHVHRWVGKNICHTQVYLPDVHKRAPQGGSFGAELGWQWMSEYLRRKGAKAFHDPLAAVLHRHPELGVWVAKKPERRQGKFGVVDVPEGEQHWSLVDLAKPPWEAYWAGLLGASA